jgi:putative transposase
MADLFKGRYRVQSARCPKWDYRSNGAYFVTICTAGRIHYFGRISDGKMNLSEPGKVVEQNFAQIPNHFPFVELDEFVVMPNHFHGIVLIKNSFDHRLGNINVIKRNLPGSFDNIYSEISPKKGSLSTVIRSFKSSCTREINQGDPAISFKWQPRYYDHIIRDTESHKRIRRYIINNPKKWKADLFYR